MKALIYLYFKFIASVFIILAFFALNNFGQSGEWPISNTRWENSQDYVHDKSTKSRDVCLTVYVFPEDNSYDNSAHSLNGTNLASSLPENNNGDANSSNIKYWSAPKVTIAASDYLFISPKSIAVSSSSGSTSFSVISNVKWSVSDDASWLTATKKRSKIDVSYEANTSTSSRTASITATGKGVTETVTVIQSGASASLDISPNSQTVDASSGSTTFSVSSNVSWSVSDDASWLTASQTDGSTITASYNSNTSTSSRTANITATGTGGVTETVTVTQSGASASLDISPNSQTVDASSGSTTFSVSSNVSWNVSDDASWLTATQTDESTITASYEMNTSTSSRTANITASGTGGVTETVTVTQSGASASLDISPNSQTADASPGSTTFSVSSNVNWSVSDDASWLTATQTDGSTITVTYDTNTSTSSRTANITATGTGGVTETVTVIQSGITAFLDISPNSQTVDTSSGSTTFSVSSNVNWSVSDDASWLTATQTDESTITVSYDMNTSTSSRTANITANGTGGMTGTVTVIQSGASAYLDISPNSQTVDDSSGLTTFSVSTNTSWNISDDASWLTATQTDGSTITVSCETNTSTSSRTANITATGTGGVTETVTVTQSGAPAYLDISPNSRAVDASSGSTTFSISTNVSWSISNDASWLTATITDVNIITVSYNTNTSKDSRTAHITATGTGGVTETVTVIQSGESAYLDISPNSKTVDASSGSTTFSINTNVSWSISNDASWLTAIITDVNIITVSYDTNTSASSRTAHITATGTGGVTETVTVIQSGASAYLDISPDSKTVSSSSGSTSFSVSSNVSWSVSDDASWLTATQTDENTLTVVYNENTSTDLRSAEIMISGAGVDSMTVIVEQEAAIPNTITDVFENTLIKIYPNPTYDKLYIEPGSDLNFEILISLYDNDGKLLFSNKINKLSANDAYEINISDLKCGFYILQLNNTKSIKFVKVGNE